VSATIFYCLGIDPHKELTTSTGRPIQLFRESCVIERLLAEGAVTFGEPGASANGGALRKPTLPARHFVADAFFGLLFAKMHFIPSLVPFVPLF
jgi:hypothetical protein